MLRVTSAVATEPVSLVEAKDMLRIDGTEFDAQLPLLIAAARETVENQTGQALVAASYEWTPVGTRVDPLPLAPATLTSAVGVYPITFTTAPAQVPAALKVAMVLLVGEMIRNPEAVVTQEMLDNPAFRRLVWPYRRMDL